MLFKIYNSITNLKINRTFIYSINYLINIKKIRITVISLQVILIFGFWDCLLSTINSSDPITISLMPMLEHPEHEQIQVVRKQV